jgi:hypothetical protein
MMQKAATPLFVLLASIAAAQSGTFPVLGATYQLDRGRYPERLVICSTAKAMLNYDLAQAGDDKAKMRSMVFNIETSKDFARMKSADGCTLISSFSQAKVVEKGKGYHRAEFAAFPFEPMWGSALYFGARVTR